MIKIVTRTPQELLDSIYESIDNETIDQWMYDDVKDFTLTSGELKNTGWFSPSISESKNALVMEIVTFENKTLTIEEEGVFCGKLIEMFMIHFKDQFTAIRVFP